MNVQISDRGFKHPDPIPSAYGGTIKAYESSSAMHPHIWVLIECPAHLNEPDGPTVEAVAHLRIEHAQQLRDQLTYLIENHYQTQ